MQSDLFKKYIIEINKAFLRGDATEHTHRPALKVLIEGIAKNITATNEPKRTDCGAPDFAVSIKKRRIDQTIGYIECKDIGKDLTKESKNEQIKERYLKSFDNFLLTDYIEFRLYLNGEKNLIAKLAEESGGKFKTTPEKIEKVSLLLRLFLDHRPQRITTAKNLAIKMAGIAKLLREIIHNTFSAEQQTVTLHSQFAAFKEVLIHDLTEVQFADMYAQIICYGLFSARCHIDDIILYGKDPHAVFHGIDEKSKKFTRETAAYLLPKTNPFLRKTFNHIAGPELDDRIAWLVDDLVELLRHCDMGTILRDFARQTSRKDPVVHFYETFLAEYDKKLKKSRGVYYTPDEVVSYIVRSVDTLLKEKFGLKRGLADDTKIKGTDQHKLLILDPAVGTGTFLFEAINQIHDKFKRQKGTWSSYVKDHLLPRIFGFELMMAPYAICHMKLGLELAETGYEFDSDDRLGVYLTNTLEEAEEKAKSLFAQWIADEAREANEIKRVLPIMVVTGNPPYSGHSANRSWMIDENGKKVPNFIGRLLKDYYQVDGKPLGEKNPKWLQDDYVKFIRFGQHRIEKTGFGILALITNHSYLDNPTFRGMRQSLMKTFDEIYVLDLHGNQKKKETCPDGSKDVNVFDIQQGVAVGIFVRNEKNDGDTKIYHADLYGLRKDKYKWLVENNIKNTLWNELKPIKPFYLFTRQNIKLLSQYNKYWKITDVIPLNGVGMTTARDNVVIDFETKPILERAKYFKETVDSNKEICKKLNISMKKGWDIDRSKMLICAEKDLKSFIKNISYRPFDSRFIFYHDSLVWRTVRRVMQHMLKGKNLGLAIGRAGQVIGPEVWDIVFCTRQITEFNLFRRGGNNLFPLYLYSGGEKEGLFENADWPRGKNGHVPNFNKNFIDEFAAKVKLEFVSYGNGDLNKNFGPEDIFHYIYAVLHSPEYRKRYSEFLKIDFPRIPLPASRTIFKRLCKVGSELTALHLMESEILDEDKRLSAFDIENSNIVEKGYPKYIAHADKPKKGKVYINKDQFFEGIKPDVWSFNIGGYQVCEKWLKDRRGREISYDDINHYQKIVVALGETIRLMKEVDEVIKAHGGWPMKSN